MEIRGKGQNWDEGTESLQPLGHQLLQQSQRLWDSHSPAADNFVKPDKTLPYVGNDGLPVRSLTLVVQAAGLFDGPSAGLHNTLFVRCFLSPT